MNFRGIPGAGNFHGRRGVQGRQDILMDSHLMGQEAFHEPRQGVSSMFPEPIPPEMDYRTVHRVLDCLSHYSVSSVCFDREELLWTGTHRGHVSSYYGMDFHKHTAFQVSPADVTEPEVRQILTIDSGVLSLTSTNLRLTLRRGLPVYNFSDSDMQQMQCMIEIGPDSIRIGGHHNKVIEFNTRKGQVVSKFEVDNAGCAIFRQAGKYLCAGDAAGKVTLYDVSTMHKEHVLDAHSSMLSDFDIQGHLLVTCGFSRRMNNLVADRLLMVYDMRVMRAMAPIQVSIDPTFLRFVPTLSNHLIVVSQMGSFQLTETTAMTPSMMIFPIDTHGAGISSFDISETCQALAFGDTAGYVHLFANNEHAVFNSYDRPTEFAVPFEPPLRGIHITDDLASLSTVPMIYPVSEPLLSDWPSSMTAKIYRKPKPIDPDILRSMKVVHNVHCVPNPGKTRRNQVPYKLGKENTSNRTASIPESPIGRGEDPFVTVPKHYQRMLMRYTKLDDFDFRHYNKTNYAGLIAEQANSYCNGMLQTLYFIEPLRATLLSHICQREFCLACELGFLFHMLDTKKGEACQAKNFLRAFRTIPEASALSLVLTETEEANGQANIPRLIPSWHRFVLHQIHSETCQQADVTTDASEAGRNKETTATETVPEKKQESSASKAKKKKKKNKKKEDKVESVDPGEEGTMKEDSARSVEEQQDEPVKSEEVSLVLELFAIKFKSSFQCRCGVETWRDMQTMLITLNYPSPAASGNAIQQVTFAEVLHHSLTGQSTMQTWCNECDRYQQHIQRRRVTSLPDILAVDCHLENEKEINFWKTQLQILKSQEEEAGDSESLKSISRPRTKCRYGAACRRKDCRYWHGGDRNKLLDKFIASMKYSHDRKVGKHLYIQLYDHLCNDRQADSFGGQYGPSWIPMGLQIKLQDDGDVFIQEISDEEPLPEDENRRREIYEVYAVVYCVHQQDTGRHLVSSVKVGEPYHQRKEGVTCHQWYLFNDFSITPIEKPENVAVDLAWRLPCIVYFSRRTILQHHDTTVRSWCKPDILYNDPALINPKRRKITFLPLQHDEVLVKGDLVGLDAEFISLKEEEAELRSDGTKSTIRPSHNSPGRITCIRGQGEHVGEPFIDDYILTPEHVTDYLTEFSGIEPSELDPSTSTKHLTTLKSSYQKLRCLLNIGVVFVGHGLKKDFKVINLQVPKEQIIDTVQLFHLPRQRFVSLRFLAWYFLDKNIQSGGHDSAEDARTALQLYRRYRELEAEGPDQLHAAIKDLYETGRKMSWKIPDSELVDSETWKGPDPDAGDSASPWPAPDSEDDLLDNIMGYL